MLNIKKDELDDIELEAVQQILLPASHKIIYKYIKCDLKSCMDIQPAKIYS